jgi:hypothetical protein
MTVTVAVPEMNHPTEETLAAFVDRRLAPAERQEVIKHMAECAECRDVIVMTTEIKAVEASATGNVVRGPFGWKRIVPLATAASIVLVVGMPQTRERMGFGPMRAVTKLAQTLDERPSEARLSFDVAHKQAKSVPRGGKKVGDPTTQVKAEEAKNLADQKPTVANLRAAGTMLMLANMRREAVDYLQRATKAAEDPSTALLTDLTAAYLANGDYPKALKTAESAWRMEQTPITAWNRALALEYLGTNDAAAKAAWNEYLAMDGDSPWAQEAREHLSRFP